MTVEVLQKRADCYIDIQLQLKPHSTLSDRKEIWKYEHDQHNNIKK